MDRALNATVRTDCAHTKMHPNLNGISISTNCLKLSYYLLRDFPTINVD